MSAFFLQKNSSFCPKKYLHWKQYCDSWTRDFLVLLSVFVEQKVTNENLTFGDSLSRIQHLDCSKLAKNLINNNHVTFFWYDVIIKVFWHCFVFLAKFGYWSKFHVNIITGSGIMTIFLYKGWSRNLVQIPPTLHTHTHTHTHIYIQIRVKCLTDIWPILTSTWLFSIQLIHISVLICSNS